MIGPYLPLNDEKWQCFTTLLEVMRLVFKTFITELEIVKLETLIQKYISSYKARLSPNIIPKMHFLIHYPRHISFFGTLGAFLVHEVRSQTLLLQNSNRYNL